jgi:hypothetical protein
MTIINTEKKYVFIHIPKTGGQTIKRTIGDGGITCKPFDFVYKSECCAHDGKLRNTYHYTGQEIKEHYGNIDLNDYTVFTFVRNPYDRLYSLYMELKYTFETHMKSIRFMSIILTIILTIVFTLIIKSKRHVLLILPLFTIILYIYIIRHLCVNYRLNDIATSLISESFNDFIHNKFECVYTLFYHFVKPQYLYTQNTHVDFIGREETFTKDVTSILTEIKEPITILNKNIRHTNRINHDYKYIDKLDTQTIRIVNQVYKRDFEVFGYDKIII